MIALTGDSTRGRDHTLVYCMRWAERRERRQPSLLLAWVAIIADLITSRHPSRLDQSVVNEVRGFSAKRPDTHEEGAPPASLAHMSFRAPIVVSTLSVTCLKLGLALKPSWIARLADMSAPYSGDGVYGCASGKGSA